MISLNNKLINITMFSDNTSQVWQIENLNDGNNIFNIKWEFEHEGEIIHLVQLVDLLVAETPNNRKLNLFLDYLPYGRQDKEISNNSTFALYSFKRIIDGLNFGNIYILDPHSNVFKNISTSDNVESIRPYKYIYMTIGATNPDIICYPDGGAAKRYTEFIDFPSICASKKRDQKTGQILEIKCEGNVKGKKVLIVDDICDGGRTFIELTKKLYNKGATIVNLYTTHGIYSSGLKVMNDVGIKNIYNKNGKVSEIQGNICYDRV